MKINNVGMFLLFFLFFSWAHASGPPSELELSYDIHTNQIIVTHVSDDDDSIENVTIQILRNGEVSQYDFFDVREGWVLMDLPVTYEGKSYNFMDSDGDRGNLGVLQSFKRYYPEWIIFHEPFNSIVSIEENGGECGWFGNSCTNGNINFTTGITENAVRFDEDASPSMDVIFYRDNGLRNAERGTVEFWNKVNGKKSVYLQGTNATNNATPYKIFVEKTPENKARVNFVFSRAIQNLNDFSEEKLIVKEKGNETIKLTKTGEILSHSFLMEADSENVDWHKIGITWECNDENRMMSYFIDANVQGSLVGNPPVWDEPFWDDVCENLGNANTTIVGINPFAPNLGTEEDALEELRIYTKSKTINEIIEEFERIPQGNLCMGIGEGFSEGIGQYYYDGLPPIVGDVSVNGNYSDGFITNLDALITHSYFIVNNPEDPRYLPRSRNESCIDMSGDGEISNLDSLMAHSHFISGPSPENVRSGAYLDYQDYYAFPENYLNEEKDIAISFSRESGENARLRIHVVEDGNISHGVAIVEGNLTQLVSTGDEIEAVSVDSERIELEKRIRIIDVSSRNVRIDLLTTN